MRATTMLLVAVLVTAVTIDGRSAGWSVRGKAEKRLGP